MNSNQKALITITVLQVHISKMKAFHKCSQHHPHISNAKKKF